MNYYYEDYILGSSDYPVNYMKNFVPAPKIYAEEDILWEYFSCKFWSIDDLINKFSEFKTNFSSLSNETVWNAYKEYAVDKVDFSNISRKFKLAEYYPASGISEIKNFFDVEFFIRFTNNNFSNYVIKEIGKFPIFHDDRIKIMNFDTINQYEKFNDCKSLKDVISVLKCSEKIKKYLADKANKVKYRRLFANKTLTEKDKMFMYEEDYLKKKANFIKEMNTLSPLEEKIRDEYLKGHFSFKDLELFPRVQKEVACLARLKKEVPPKMDNIDFRPVNTFEKAILNRAVRKVK